MTNIPKRHSVEQMARELGVISTFQAAEVAMETDNLTLGFDATTQDGTHINSIHFTTVDKCVVVAIDQLAGGTAEDYEQHICDSVDELALTYSNFNNLDYQDCRQTIIGNISNTLTDRVAVNHAAIVRIKQRWGTDLNELNCHLHPLDTIASSCRSALKTLETERGSLFGMDCMAANIVLQMNKMRYKDGKGDPKGFVVFLDDNNLPRGILPRYRGNRLHVLFHICGKLIQHHSLFLEFLTSGTVSCGGLQSSLRHDFVHEIAQLEMQVLGLFGKLLTGPWMKKFYTSAVDQIDHIDGIEVVRKVVAILKECNGDPIRLLSCGTDFFGDNLDKDEEVLKKLRTCPSDLVLQERMRDMLAACLAAVITVLERQYQRYFTMDLTDALRKETQSARSHNIDAEEVMGMFSAAKQRSPNATICYLSSRMTAKKNHTVEYHDSMELEKRDNLVKWSIGKGRKRRQLNRRKQKQLMAEMSSRVATKRQKKQEKDMKSLEQRLRHVNLDQLEEEFQNLDANTTLADLHDVLSGRAIGRSICHVWYDATTHNKIVYSGLIEKFKRKNSNKYVISYWSKEGSQDDAVDYDVSKFEMGIDLIYEDLVLC